MRYCPVHPWYLRQNICLYINNLNSIKAVLDISLFDVTEIWHNLSYVVRVYHLLSFFVCHIQYYWKKSSSELLIVDSNSISRQFTNSVRYRGHGITFISSIQIVLICSFSTLSHQLKSPTTAAPDTGDGAEEMAMKRLWYFRFDVIFYDSNYKYFQKENHFSMCFANNLFVFPLWFSLVITGHPAEQPCVFKNSHNASSSV